MAGSYILNRLRNELNSDLFYHNASHVTDVMQSAEMIGKLENINDQDMELLKVAALFHDSGFIINSENHEQHSCSIAKDYLPTVGYTETELALICELIMATRVPQLPHTHLEKIICDADLDYLGRDDFFTTGNKIYKEFQARNLISGEREWNELQLKFLTEHKYFTGTSVNLRNEKKAIHLDQVRRLLKETV